MSNAAFNLLWNVRQMREAQEVAARRAGMVVGAKLEQFVVEALMEKCRERAAAIIAA